MWSHEYLILICGNCFILVPIWEFERTIVWTCNKSGSVPIVSLMNCVCKVCIHKCKVCVDWVSERLKGKGSERERTEGNWGSRCKECTEARSSQVSKEQPKRTPGRRKVFSFQENSSNLSYSRSSNVRCAWEIESSRGRRSGRIGILCTNLQADKNQRLRLSTLRKSSKSERRESSGGVAPQIVRSSAEDR